MADPRDRAPEVPDLDLPKPRATAQPAPRPEMPAAEPRDSGAEASPSIDGIDPLDMEIERTGALTASSPAFAHASSPRSASGLEVTYRRLDPDAEAAPGPSWLARVGAVLAPILGSLGSATLLWKVAHARGGHAVMTLLPHAFDATSVVESGALALTALAAAIALGFVGLKVEPRSMAILGSAGMLLLTSLAMTTITLVATEEHPSPPDGALLIPYAVPLGLLLLGLGVTRRGVYLFSPGGAGRALAAFLLGAIGGALVFAAVELSALAALLP